MSGSKSKRAGSSYEYRIRNWFKDREGWDAKRVMLSGAVEEIGRHDVHAWKDDIYLTIEAKKRTKVKDLKKRDQIEVKAEWLENILFEKDESLVFATNQSPHYCLLPTKRFFQLLGRSFDIEYSKENTFKGKSQFLFKRTYVDETEDNRFHLVWNRENYTVFLLEEYVTLRETADMDDDLSFEDRIKRLSTLEKALAFEKLSLSDLSYREKRQLYARLEELESGTLINPIFHSNQQFWMDDAFVMICPKCDETVTKKDLSDARKKKDEGFIDWDRD